MTPTRPDTSDMVLLDNAYRREFTILPAVVENTPQGEPKQIDLVTRHIRIVFASLHNHHEGEDSVLWPALSVQASPAEDNTDVMLAQHAELADAINDAGLAASRWATTRADDERSALTASLRRHHPLLIEHLDLEERDTLPLVETLLTTETWDALEKESRSRLPRSPRENVILIGMLLEDATEAERGTIYAKMPAVMRPLWRYLGQRYYQAYVARLRRGIVPAAHGAEVRSADSGSDIC